MSTFNPLTGTNNPFNGIDAGSFSAPRLGDIDGDGDLDLVVGESFGTLRYYRNTGTATAPAYAEQTGANNPLNGINVGIFSAPSLGDIDGDGDLDLVVGEFDGVLNFYRNIGTATAPVYAEQTGTNNPFNGIDAGSFSAPRLGDIDGDGDLDLVVGESFGTLRYYRNTGTATAPAYAEQTGANNPFNGIDVGTNSKPSLGDIDGDGDLDLVVGELDGVLNYYGNTGTATAPVYAEQAGTNNPFNGFDVGFYSTPNLGDIDSDGDLDLVVGEIDGALLTFQNQATATTPVYAGTPPTGNPFNGIDVGIDSAPTLGDIDGDGDLDLVVGERDGFLNYYRNTGTATVPVYAVQNGTDNPFNGFDVGDNSFPSLGDIDGDGDLDLVVGASNGTLSYYRNAGTATTPVYVGTPATGNPFNGFDVGNNSVPSLGDIDGDGDLDLVLGNRDGALNYARNTGTATAPVYVGQEGTNNPFNGIDVGFDSTPSLGDIDGDGDLDLVVGEGDGVLNYYRNTGTATAPVYAVQTGTNNPFGGFDVGSNSTPSLSDIDGDGDLDLVIGNRDGLVLTAFNNDAPTLGQAALNLTGTNEDTDSAPVTVASLLASAGWADSDARALQGLAVTGSTGAGWQYSVDGSTWTPVGAASATAAVLLGQGTQLRYAPDRNNGETPTLSFRAWDQTSGTASTDGTASTADTTTNGGGSAFSTASSTASLVVTPVNDAPVVGTSSGSTTYSENSSAVVVDPALTVGDVDSAQLVGAVVSISSNFVPGQDSLQFSNQLGITGSWNTGTGQLTLSGTASVASYQTALRSVTYLNNSDAPDTTPRVMTFTASDGLATSTAATRNVAVTAVNDAPVVNAAGLTLNEGQTVTLSAANFTVVDPDSTSFTYAVSGVAGGFFQLSTAPGAAVTGFTAAQLAGGLVQFVDDGNEVAPAFSITANDGALNSNLLAATINYTPVNDAPVVNAAALTLNEGQTVTLSAANFTVVDPDSTSFTFAVSGVAGGFFQLSAAPGAAVTGFTAAQLAGGLVQFVDDGNEVAPAFSITANDGALSSNTLAATINYTPVNDAPGVNAAALTLNEGQTVTLSAANFTVVDPDNTGFTFSVSGLVGGFLQLSTAAGTAVTGFTSAQLAGGLVQFVDDGNEVAPAFSITANDGALDSNTLAATINYTPVNDAPAVNAAALTLNEGQTVTLSAANFTVVDPDSTSFTFAVSGMAGGFFQLSTASGAAVTGFTAAQLTGGLVQFVDDGNEVAPAFSITANDGALNSNPLVATINYSPVNDAPVVNAAALTLNEGQTVTLSAANFTVVDPDNSSFTFSVSGLAGGFFQLSTAAGTPVTTFTSAQLTGGLLQFVDDGNEVAPVFSITANDGALNSNTLSATINYTPVNDAPTTSPVTLLPAMPEDSGTRTITQAMLLANAADVDGPAPKAENLQISGGLGNLVDNGNGTWNYTPAPNDDTSVSFSYSVSDGSLSAAGSATLDLTPVNDAPVAVNDTAQTALNTGVNIGVVANDTDIDGLLLQVSAISAASNGSVVVRPDLVSVRYTPSTGFSGFDSFNYTVNDGVGGSATASVRVLVASISGSNGNDTTLGSQQADFVLGLDGADRIFTYGGADYVDGGRGADTITGGDGADTLLGGDGPDTFLATSAELAGDSINGGNGTDILVITSAPASMPANFSFTNLEQISYTGGLLVEHTSLLDLSSLTLASGSSNSITGGTANSRITGTASADNIVDSAGNDDLRGAGGNDTIVGGFGQDTINGGTGNDVLYGGTATAPNDFVRDIFVFNTPLNATTNVDRIIGFQANSQDRIQLDGSIFSAITGGTTTGLDADEFRSVNGGNAQDGNDFIIFDPLTGNLFYDADGHGTGAMVLFATLVGLTGTLDVTDFVVVSVP